MTMGQPYSQAAAATSRSEPQDLGSVSFLRYSFQSPGSPALVGILPENHAAYLELFLSMCTMTLSLTSVQVGPAR